MCYSISHYPTHAPIRLSCGWHPSIDTSERGKSEQNPMHTKMLTKKNKSSRLDFRSQHKFWLLIVLKQAIQLIPVHPQLLGVDTPSVRVITQFMRFNQFLAYSRGSTTMRQVRYQVSALGPYFKLKQKIKIKSGHRCTHQIGDRGIGREPHAGF